jgi:hypothetical protein
VIKKGEKKRNTWKALEGPANVPEENSGVAQEGSSHMRGRASVEMMGLDFPVGTHCRMRKGKFVFRRASGSGADSKKMPMELYLEARLAEYKAAGNKVTRNLNMLQMNLERKGKKARRPKADALRDEILRLAEQYASKGSSLNAFIAKKVDRSPDHVRKIRNKAEKRESSEKS